MHFLERLARYAEKEKISQPLTHLLHKFYLAYSTALVDNNRNISHIDPLLIRFLDMVVKQLQKPFHFNPFHKRVIKPFDYYHFGLDFLRPLIIFEQSKILGLQQVDKMEEQLAKKDNIILFANHQIEPDPQIINLLLEKTHPHFAEKMIFVAGHRVISDPLAVPFSKGCNLLCIYSKKYIETPPEKKREKLLHNQKTMKELQKLLNEGGHCIYVAPSGGRDRPNKKGVVDVAPFDPQSVEFFYLMGKQSKHPTHFYPLSLATYNLLPPPNSVEVELGEKRQPKCSPAHLEFCPELDMENIPGCKTEDKRSKRQKRAKHIWQIVHQSYKRLIS